MKLYWLQILIGKWELVKLIGSITWCGCLHLIKLIYLYDLEMKLSSHVVEVCDFNETKFYICLTDIYKKNSCYQH